MDKRCSTSTDVETVHDVLKITNPLQKAYEELTETMEELHEFIQSRPNLPVISFGKESPKKKEEPIYINECNFGNKDHLGNNDDTLFAIGFDNSLPRRQIKTALKKHFSSCGKVTRVYVPIECATGATLGFAFIDLKNGPKKGLALSGSYLGGRKLHVMMARYRGEFFGFTDFIGCERCCNYRPWWPRTDDIDYSCGYWLKREISRRTFGSPYSKIGRFTASIAIARLCS